MRFQTLDLLRAIAIIGVLLRHSRLDYFWMRAGWVGVDLFFVLSGFLVSGLLFNEFKKLQNVNVLCFLIRRGFKIYPCFYFFLALAICFNLFILEKDLHMNELLGEVFFLQNYLGAISEHTWSLAIEEQFYFFIGLSVYLAFKFKLLGNQYLFPCFLLTGLLGVFALRWIFTFYIAARQ